MNEEKSRSGKEYSALVAIATFTNFTDDNGSMSIREGGELDEGLAETFKDSVDCKVMKFKSEKKDKDAFAKFVKDIQAELTRSNFKLLFFIVSSHGAFDIDGDFFYDCNQDRIYVKHDLVNKFAIDKCSTMEDKKAVFLINACRVRCQSPNPHPPVVEQPEIPGMLIQFISVYSYSNCFSNF